MRWDKTTVAHSFRRSFRAIGRLRTWQLLVLLLMMTIVSATFLRLNSLGMLERRSAVIEADVKGDKAVLRTSIVELQSYISKHMNTSLVGGLYLSKSYERDRDAALAAAEVSTNPQSAVYQQASVECRERFRGGVASFRNDYVQCVVEKLASLSPQTDPTKTLKLPKADAYKVNFASPLWTPDIAGFSVLVCALLVLAILVRLITKFILRIILRRYFQNA